jgi:hypothetical protein
MVSLGGVRGKLCNFSDFAWVSKADKKIPGSKDPGYSTDEIDGEFL